jgi:FKBP-type peptidyl-prolyl cis-trans isomerase
MKRTIKIYGLTLIAGFFLATNLTSCLNEEKAFLEDRKAQNEQEIAEYLRANNLTLDKNSLGLYYKLFSSGISFKKAAYGDEIQYHYKVTRLDGYVVDTSGIVMKTPSIATYGIDYLPYVTSDATIAIFDQLVKEGDSAAFVVPFSLGRGAQGTLDLPAYSPFRMDLKVVRIRTEDEQINDFIATHTIFYTEKSEDGLRFGKLVSQPDSALLEEGKTYSVKYQGRLMNNMLFDSSTFDVTMGSTSLVTGFTEGLKKLRVGEKANLVFPSALGYGAQGSQSSSETSAPTIRPFSPLYFQVEIVKKK